MFDKRLLKYLSPEDRAFVNQCIELAPVWCPHEDNIPQQLAYECDADILGYGGAAGGGKTDLGLGKALNKHKRVAIFRRESTQLTGIIDRLTEILGGRDGFNGQDKIWRNAGPRKVQIELGSTPNPGDETKHQGRAKDLLVIEEAANFLISQVLFLMGWVRTTDPNQTCQTVMTFNPPTTAEGQWVIEFFAPWLDPKFPNPAQSGEKRWAASLPATENYPNGRHLWLPTGAPFVLDGDNPVYDFNPLQYKVEDIITPKTRTFISARVSDNPYLLGTGYMSTLQALPEPLRSQMLKGDFLAGMQDDPWQVIPTAWIEFAMKRWRDQYPKPPMDSMGIDVARGGKDNTIIARRHGVWFDVPLVFPGSETPDGPKVAGLVMANCRDGAVQHIDVIGVGSSPYDFLNQSKQPVVGVNVSERATGTDKSGRLQFFNQRSQLYWKMREALDPDNNTGIMLPDDSRLKADLCAAKWSLQGPIIRVESRDEIVKRLHRSADWASAYLLALLDTPKTLTHAVIDNRAKTYDPYDLQGRVLNSQGNQYYDPYNNI